MKLKLQSVGTKTQTRLNKNSIKIIYVTNIPKWDSCRAWYLKATVPHNQNSFKQLKELSMASAKLASL